MIIRSLSLSRRLGLRSVLAAVALAVLPSCKSLSEHSLFDTTSADKSPAADAKQESSSATRLRRDPNVVLASDDQPINEAPAPIAVPAGAPGALPDVKPGSVPLPAPPSYAKIIPGRSAKPVKSAALPALPREHEHAAACAPPIPYGVVSPWAPPGLKGPYPQDEYLHDGGDAQEPVSVSPEWRVQGLNVEDTVAHYDTLDGRTLVEQSNCTYVYAPRFSSVRTVAGVVAAEFTDAPTKIVERERPTLYDERARVGTKLEQQQPFGRVANVKPSNYRREQGVNFTSVALLPHNYQQSLLAFENLSVIRTGTMVGSEKARLAERSEAAIIWSKDDGVKVLLNKQQAVTLQGEQRAQAIFVVKGPTDARLRICKIASSPAAAPGETIDFTIRYDNIGDSTVGNIVILDSLTTRLQYVVDSAQSSRAAYFNATDNPAESLELRWEIDEELKPGEGGIVRFKCIVR